MTSRPQPRPAREADVPAGARGTGRAFERLAERSDDVIWLADLSTGRVLYVSPGFARTFGLPCEALIDDPMVWNRALHAEDAALLPEPFFADDAAPRDREYRVCGQDGRLRWLRDRRFVLGEGAGGAARIGGIAQDVTESKLREIEREQMLRREQRARAEAEAAASSKDEFLAVVTHELRSPLNAIRGWAHVLRRGGPLNAAQLRALDAIDRNTLAQARLVDDLLDSQRLLCGNLQLERAMTPLAALIDDAADALRPVAEAKRLRLEVSHDARIGEVEVDGHRLEQALRNLLSNSLKFTPEDGIVQVRSVRCDDAVVIEVHDTGAGLAPGQLATVFERFRTGDGSNARRQNGLGLGLTLARQLVELHGGRLLAHSAGPGHGATFSIELPATLCGLVPQRHADAANDQSAAPLAGKRIVIVEDDDDGREMLEMVLREARAELRSFARAAGAFEFLAHASPQERPDAVISDIAMPDEDGYAFISRWREWEQRHHAGHLVALALTAFARAEDRLRALRAGFDEHMAKPIDTQAVLGALVQAIEQHGGEPTSDSGGGGAAGADVIGQMPDAARRQG